MPKQNPKKAQLRQERARRARRERLITISVIGFIAIVFVGALILSQRSQIPSLDEIIVPEGLERNQVSGNTAGDPNAPVVVEEYSDFQCTHCRTFWQESEARLINDYVNTGKVYFKYVAFPVINQNSTPISVAAYCAMEQDKFWEFHDLLFANYDNGFADARLEAYADFLDMDVRAYNSCLSTSDYANQISADTSRASALGVTGTPTFSVNGQLTNRLELFDVIDAALAAAP